jgi:hypothetical protein
MTLQSWLSIGLPCLLAFALVHCHSDEVGHGSALVGGSCRDNGDCDERCVRGDDFPGGTCTVNCHDDRDCPDGTWCIDKAGGVCLLGCHVDDDCRRSYRCKSEDREGHGGKATVCID